MNIHSAPIFNQSLNPSVSLNNRSISLGVPSTTKCDLVNNLSLHPFMHTKFRIQILAPHPTRTSHHQHILKAQCTYLIHTETEILFNASKQQRTHKIALASSKKDLLKKLVD